MRELGISDMDLNRAGVQINALVYLKSDTNRLVKYKVISIDQTNVELDYTGPKAEPKEGEQAPVTSFKVPRAVMLENYTIHVEQEKDLLSLVIKINVSKKHSGPGPSSRAPPCTHHAGVPPFKGLGATRVRG